MIIDRITFLLVVALVIALAQIWTKPKWVSGDYYNVEKRSRWRWTYIVLWLAFASAVTRLLILPIFSHA